MSWLEAITSSIKYMEEHLTDDITAEQVAQEVNISPLYFQKGFSILCDISVSEYIRNRRLSLAGRDLRTGDCKVIDAALKYGYDSPDSFTKAFTRFHGITPVQAKLGEGELKEFLPLKLHVSMKGGFDMECKIVKKAAFTVIGSAKIIKGADGFKECPKFWDDHFASGDVKFICGMYGICIDSGSMIESDSLKTAESRPKSGACLDQTYKIPEGPGFFKYMIADDYVPGREYPEKFTTEVIPENTWAVFPCKGPMPKALQSVNEKIYKEWLPQNPDYEVAGKYNIEMYTYPSKYPKGTADENYYTEIWIPVKAK